MNQASLPANTILINKYQIIKSIGQGGFGITYLAKHIELKKNVAIKECFVSYWCIRDKHSVYPQEKFKKKFEEFNSKFLFEAQTLARLNHNSIVNVTDYFEQNNTAYFVMEFVEGRTLQGIVDQNGKLEEARAISIIIKVLEAVEFLHQRKILHRDIKPENIILKENDEIVIIDFGAAREMISTQVRHTVIQTPGYAPIEQYNESSEKGFYIDIYSIGATLYTLVTGKRPVDARKRITKEVLDEPINLDSNLSQKTNDVILRAMSLMYYNRYQSASEFLKALSQFESERQFDLGDYKLTVSQVTAMQEIDSFLVDLKTKVFILTGATCTGKSFLVKKIINLLRSKNIPSILLAGNSRIAESVRLLNSFESVLSLYTLIYNFSDVSPVRVTDENNNFTDLEDEEEIEKTQYGFKVNYDDPNMVYIVENSELISDSYTEFDLSIFGSGKLLQDFIEYSEIRLKKTKRKIIFVGDNNQLLRGSKDDSSLSSTHLLPTYSLTADKYELIETIEQTNKLVLENALRVRERLCKNKFNELKFEFDGKNVIELGENNFSDIYSKLSTKETILIEHTNRQAKLVNEKIRKLFNRKEYLEKGDRIVLHNNIEVTDDFLQTFHFSNGEFAEVVDLYERQAPLIKWRKQRNGIELKFRKLRLRFEITEKEVDVLIFENHLLAEDASINNDETVALHLLANRGFNDLKNIEKLEVLKKVAINKGITDLTEFENNLELEPKDFNKFLSAKKLLKDIRKYYLRKNVYLNAAKIKFGYCMTCHRAQGFKWSNVIINCENNAAKTNEQYFRWLYTAFTRSNSKVYLLNPPIIIPTMNLEFAANVNISIDEEVDVFLNPENFNKDSIKLKDYNFPYDKPVLKDFYKIVVDSIKGTEFKIGSIDHNSYQECYNVIGNDKKFKVRIAYNNRYLFKRPTVEDSKENKFVDLIFSPKEFGSFPQDFLKDFYLLFKEKLNLKNINVLTIIHNNYTENYTLVRKQEVLNCDINYSGEEFFSRVAPLKTNSANLLADLKSIIETKLY